MRPQTTGNQNGKTQGLTPRPERIALICLLAVIALYAYSPIEDYDFWWHLKAGEVICQTGDIIREDIFSFTSPGAYWMNHSWLSEVVMFKLWQAGEAAGSLLFKALLLMAAFMLLYRILKGAAHPLVPLLTTVGAAAATRVGWEVRPQTFSYLFIILFLWLLENRRRRWLLPPLMMIWSNAHISFFLGLVLIGVYTAEAMLNYYRPRCLENRVSLPPSELKTLLTVFLAAFAASWINPHPWLLYTHPWIVLNQFFPLGIAEWSRPTFADAPAFWGCLGLTLLSLPLAARKIRPAHLLLFLVFLYGGLRHLRNIPYLTLAMAPLLAYALSYSLKRLEEIFPLLSRPLEQPQNKDQAPAAGTPPRCPPLLNPFYHLSALFLLFLALAWSFGWAGQGGVNYRRFPQKAVDFYQRAGIAGPLFNTFDWGGYLVFRQWPQQKVFILGISSDEEVFRQYYHITEGRQFWRTLLDRYHINAILTKTCYEEGGMIPYLAKLYLDDDWRLIYQDETACLLIRAAEDNRRLEPYHLPKEKLFLTLLAEEKRLLQRKPPNPHSLYYKALAQYVLEDRGEAEKTLNLLQIVNPAYPAAGVLRQAVQKDKNPREFLQENYGR